MPLYEYRCADCGSQFEVRRTFAQVDEPLDCPDCQSDEVRRLLSRFMAFTTSSQAEPARVAGGGCACGGACACGSHN